MELTSRGFSTAFGTSMYVMFERTLRDTYTATL